MVQTQIIGLTQMKGEVHRRLVDLLYQKNGRKAPGALPFDRKEARLVVENILDGYRHSWPAGVEREGFIKDILDHTLGFGIIEDLLQDPEITEIMINGFNSVYVEKQGGLHLLPACFQNDQEVLNLIVKMISPLGRRIDESSPMVDARLPDGSRINAIIPPLCLNGPCLTVRKFRPFPFTEEELLRSRTLTPNSLAFLKKCVEGRCNILISGGTGSGKTTFLNLLANFIPKGERIITIEDAAELRLPQTHVISLESRPANLEGAGEITIRTLVRNALRMRPDRIIVGECRSGEALDMLQAMNTGHDGSMTTGHANDTREMLLRLETLVLMSGIDLPLRAIREQINSALDLVVHLERLPTGQRKVTRISEVCGMEGEIIILQDLFRLGERQHPELHPTGMIPHFRPKLLKRGLDLDLSLFKSRPMEIFI